MTPTELHFYAFAALLLLSIMTGCMIGIGILLRDHLRGGGQ